MCGGFIPRARQKFQSWVLETFYWLIFAKRVSGTIRNSASNAVQVVAGPPGEGGGVVPGPI